MKTFDRPINPGEVAIPITFDYSAKLGGATIASAILDVGVWNSGTDATPNHIVGSPVISGSLVIVYWTGGTAGVDYRIRCRATLSNGQVRALVAVLQVRDNA